MVLGELGRLTEEAVRGLARNLFAGFYERDLSANAALNELREAGLGYSRGEFLADYRADRPGYDLASSVSHITNKTIPNESLLKSQFHGVPDKYSFVFKATGLDEKGNERESYFFYHRNTLDTRENMQDDAQEYITETKNDSGFSGAEKVSLVAGYINPVWKQNVPEE